MAKNDTPASGSSKNDPLEARTNQELIDAAGAHGEGDAAIEAIEKNKNLIIAVLLIGVVVFAAVLIMKQRARSANLAAASAYSSAASDGSIDKLNAVAAEHEGTTAGGNALLMKAEKQLSSDKAQDAQTTLENFLAKYSDHPRFQQGQFALGTILHQAGDLAAARTQYETALATNNDSELAPLLQIKIADTWLESGDAEKARQLYEVIPSEHPGSAFLPRAEQKLELAKIGDIEVVKAPEPEPEPTPEPVAIPKPVIEDPVAVPASEKPKAPKAAQPQAAKPKPAQPKGNANAKGKGKGAAKGKGANKGKGQNPKGNQPNAGKAKGPKADAPAKPKPAAAQEAPKAKAKAKAEPKPADAPKPAPAPAE